MNRIAPEMNNRTNHGGIGLDGVNTSDEVIVFLLKLKNNNTQNLKNALKKIGEKTNGNKDQLLMRLAQKLATHEGKELAR